MKMSVRMLCSILCFVAAAEGIDALKLKENSLCSEPRMKFLYAPPTLMSGPKALFGVMEGDWIF